jgi:hypothetical protein
MAIFQGGVITPVYHRMVFTSKLSNPDPCGPAIVILFFVSECAVKGGNHAHL